MLRAWSTLTRPVISAGKSLPPHPRILVIRPDHLGDLLFITPALRLLRHCFPQAHITALVGPWGKAIVERVPEIDAVASCAFPGFTRQPKTALWAPYALLRQEARRWRDFDLALVLRFDHWWGALLAYMAGIPNRWGYDIPECAPFLTKVVPYNAGKHEVLQNWNLIVRGCARAGIPCPTEAVSQALAWPVDANETYDVEKFLIARGVAPSDPVVIIHPGAGAPAKRWPPERYGQVADALMEQYGVKIVVTGSRSELGLAWWVAAEMWHDPIVLAGETSLGELGALLARADLVIGSDSGPLHLAVAVGTPTLHMYGPVDPQQFGPWAPEQAESHRVLVSPRHCVPCNRLDQAPEELVHHPCMAEIPVASVLEAATALLNR
jgi:lipopolysaccharide heptosyltransferase II